MQKISIISLYKNSYAKVVQVMLLIALFSSNVKAQDTLYLDKIWEKCTKEDAAYFRVLSQTNPLQVHDYYINGKLQMKGAYTDTSYENENGPCEYYGEDGSLQKKCVYLHAQLNGLYQEYHSNGKLKTEGFYLLGNRNGTFKEFDSTGYLMITTQYKNGKIEGEVLGYYSNGKIRRKEFYNKGSFDKGVCYTMNGKDTTYYPHETFPSLENNPEALYSFLGKNIQYPPLCRELGIEGKVILKFMVNEEGKIENLTVYYSKHLLFTQEANRVIKLMPAFIPGTYEGKKVAMPFTLPIKFQLN
jgi:TonB family protein